MTQVMCESVFLKNVIALKLIPDHLKIQLMCKKNTCYKYFCAQILSWYIKLTRLVETLL